MKAILLKIDEKLKQDLQKEAKERGLPLASYIRMIIIERGK